MAEGRIVKALSGFYYVKNESGIFQCRGRGVFRKQKLTPLVGDYVEFAADNHKEGYVTVLKERKNELKRPPISNVDQAILVFSAREPDFSAQLLDRLLVHVEASGIDAMICISKMDLLTEEERKSLEDMGQMYRDLGYEVVHTSVYVDEMIQSLRPYLEGKVSLFAGQSGVGKSSLLNALRPELDLQVGDVSKHLGRGKHTTRHVELIPVNSGLVADTPGFSALDFENMTEVELSHCFPEFLMYVDDCKFRGCLHVNEPKCAVKTALEAGEISQLRYNHYVRFLSEIQNQKRRY
ncbi:ribosome small subunit-dependent GTPase A [Texcoconibacillus texcoconensis]|uniref:Small ribosomal subunit biogenesis GTPase RsgA n=1 Tax=Texcoconibacillus texcoconensis TaxID=1095777 RepID=A0A840QL89_9BACI|nr:ribosome small subunit-dependent GTPase A [Texcoconibacillus texcoconensis]MBB5172126.1 ribosome biogenesis GTPase [Texcoconibacillus texcoconensis]